MEAAGGGQFGSGDGADWGWGRRPVSRDPVSVRREQGLGWGIWAGSTPNGLIGPFPHLTLSLCSYRRRPPPLAAAAPLQRSSVARRLAGRSGLVNILRQ